MVRKPLPYYLHLNSINFASVSDVNSINPSKCQGTR